MNERIVLRGGPGHARAYMVRFGQPSLMIAWVAPMNWAAYDDTPAVADIEQFEYLRTQEVDKWGKRIYRVRK